MPLSAAAVAATTVEEAPERLLYEFLAGYFNGAAHSLNGANVTFPSVGIKFDVGMLSDPLDGAVIVVVAAATGERSYLADPAAAAGASQCDKKRAVEWSVFIKAQKKDSADAHYLCRQVTQLFEALIASPAAVKPLNQRGMMNLKTTRMEVAAAADRPTRLIKVRGELDYSN